MGRVYRDDELATLAQGLKPFVLPWLAAEQTVLAGGGGGLSAHALNGAYHSGTIANAQAPQFLLTNGARELTGNLSLGAGVTIDGVDISAHAADANAHHTRKHDILSTSDHEYTGGANLDVFGLSAANTLAKLTPSADVSGGASAILRSNAGALTLLSATVAGNLSTDRVASNLIPSATDTYDLGSSTLLWRKGWLSELDTILFSQNTITLLGGWFYVTPDAGVLPSNVTSGMTAIDFGKTMTLGDFIVMRSSLTVEYMKILSSGGGTVYNVTRDLDGTGANNWAGGTPFAVLGQSGDGRIEFNAYNRPKIQMLTQGATYNAQTEIVRIGDLDTGWGYSAETYGFALGEYAAGKPNITLDLTNGLRFRTHTTDKFVIDGSGSAYFAGVVRIGTAGELRQGTASAGDLDGSFGGLTAFTGLRIWRESNIGRIAGYDSGNIEWSMATDGEVVFAQDKMRFHRDGFAIKRSTTLSTSNDYALCWWDDPSPAGRSGALRARLYMAQEDAAPIRNAGVFLAGTGNYGAGIVSDNAYVFCTWGASGYDDIQLGGNTAVFGTLDVSGDVALGTGDTSPTVAIGDATLTTGDAALTIGEGRTGSGNAYIDLVGDATYTDYGLRIVRNNAGANAESKLSHRGTGNFVIEAVEAAAMYLQTSDTTRIQIASDGLVGIGVAPATARLKVVGSVAVGGDDGGQASYVTFTNTTNLSVSTGSGTVKLTGASNRNSDGWVKVYIGTTPYYLPAWSNIG